MRKLRKNFRIVATGDSRGAHKIWTEHRVQDGDMSESPGKLELEELDEGKSVDEIWNETVALAKEQEGIK